MNRFQKIVYPFSILYGWITSLRNWLYFNNFKKRTSFNLPIIAVGNLSVGGTGKTPLVEYLVRLLEQHYTVATLSRGYKRKSKGFVMATPSTTVQEIGDEPFQYFSKFKNLTVAVDAKRVNGIRQLLQRKPELDAIILDDAYQHLAVKAGLYILLTTFSDLYCCDYLLPSGTLRESKKGASRADIIIVTKCPTNLSLVEQRAIRMRLRLLPHQSLFFSYIEYSTSVHSKKESISIEDLDRNKILLVAGIAKPLPFYNYMKGKETFFMRYPDHHNFTKSDIEEITAKANGQKIITTEKDFVRLNNQLPAEQLYCLPIQTSFLRDAERLDQIILDYVGKNSKSGTIHSN